VGTMARILPIRTIPILTFGRNCVAISTEGSTPLPGEFGRASETAAPTTR
jgi:hypothetical protein